MPASGGTPYGAGPSAEDELAGLKREAEELTRALESVRQRMEDLEAHPKETQEK